MGDRDSVFSDADVPSDSTAQSPLGLKNRKQSHSERKQLAHRRGRLPTLDAIDVALSKSIRDKIIQAVSNNEFSRGPESKEVARQLSVCLLSNNKEAKDYADLFLLIDHDNGKHIIEAFCEDTDFKIESLRHEESNFNVLQYALEYNKWDAAQAILQLTRPEFIISTRLKNHDSHEVETCLHRLIASGQDQLTTLLLAKLADCQKRMAYVTKDTLIHEWGERLKVSALHLAALGGYLDVVQHLVQEERVPADLRTNNMATAAFLAIRKGHVAVAQWLIEAERSQADLADTAGLTLLHYAVLSDNDAAVKFALSLHNVSSQMRLWTLDDNPLLIAAQRGHANVVLSLLGCQEIMGLLNCKSKAKGNTPLHNACMGRTPGDTAVAEILLTAGADIRSFNKYRETPLMLAAQSGNADTLITICAEFAKRTSADEGTYGTCDIFDDVSEDGKTVWHYAIEADNGSESAQSMLRALMEFLIMCNHDAAQGGSESSGDMLDGNVQDQVFRMDTVDFLDEKPFSPSQGMRLQTWNRLLSSTEPTMTTSPLHIAASIGSLEKLKVLLLPAYSHRCSFFDSKKNNFLHAAAYHGKTQVLLQYGTHISVNQQNADGDTALHIACRGGHFECVRKLLPMANVKLANKDGCLLLHELCSCSDVAAEILTETVQRMRDVSWDLLYHRDSKGRTALHILSGLCLSAPAEDVFSVFLKCTLIRELDCGGNMPIHTALLAGRLDNFAALLKVFADTLDINARNSDGKTPLILAAERMQVRAVSMQLSHGADLLAADNDGNTALHRIIINAAHQPEKVACYLEIMQLLFDAAVMWHCRQRRLAPIPRRDSVRGDSPDVQYWQCFREAVLKLVVLARNNQGMNAVYLAAKLNTVEVLSRLLQLEGVFVLSKGNRTTNGPCGYDVTDMVFNTLSRYDLYRAPAPLSPPKEDDVDNCTSPLLRAGGAKKRIGKKRDVAASPAGRQPALAEVIVNNGYPDCWKLLDIPAIDRVTTDYWTPYRWLYIACLVLHLVYMSVLSSTAVRNLDQSGSACHSTGGDAASAPSPGVPPAGSGINLATTAANRTGNVSSGGADVLLAMGGGEVLTTLIILSWPTALLVRFALFLAFALARPSAKVKETLSQLMSNVARHPVTFVERITFHLLAAVFSCLVVVWFALFVLRSCGQQYVLAVALLLGWVYTVQITSGLAGLHHFTVILQRIIFRDLFSFAFVFLLLTLGFSLAFLVASRTAAPLVSQFSSEGISIFAVLKAWVGAGDVVDMSLLTGAQYATARSFLSSLYVCCMIIMAVVMTNMLIAMMNDSYHDIYAERKLVWRIDTLKTSHQLDRHYPFVGKMLRRVLGSDKKITQETIFVDGQPLQRFVMPSED